MDFSDLVVQTNSPVLNNVLNMFHGIVIKFLRSYENGYGQYFNTILEEYNLLLRTHSYFHEDWPDPMHHRFNTTMVHPPIINAQNQTITLAVDGTIFDTHL